MSGFISRLAFWLMALQVMELLPPAAAEFRHWELTEEEKEDWELPKKKGSGRLRGNIGFPTRVVKDPSLGRYRACKSDDEEGCFSVVRMFFAIWYDMRHDWFDFEDGAYLTLSSGGGHTYHADFVYGWDKSMAKQIVTDTTNYNAQGKIIGGPDAVVKSPECAKLDDEDPFLWDSDWDAMLQANAGNGTVVLGHYNRGLTITDGKSVNATWNGKWGERPRVVEEPLTYQNALARPSLHANETASSYPPPAGTTASMSGVDKYGASATNCARRHMKKRPKHL
ncbi:DUF1996 domain-containing protein [Fusarium sp. Ph1]|nr:DUF1996 domain-containing protein [Fusarium sp. Ph1]